MNNLERHKAYKFIVDSLGTSNIGKDRRLPGAIGERYKDSKNINVAAEGLLEEINSEDSEWNIQSLAGFYIEKGEWRWNAVDEKADIIPLLDEYGCIHSLKIRSRKENIENRYSCISTQKLKRQKGAGQHSFIHFPKEIEQGKKYKRIRITEGEIKADVCNFFDSVDELTISMGSIAHYKKAIEELKILNIKAEKLYLAYDGDIFEKGSVDKGTQTVTLVYKGYTQYKKLLVDEVFFERWNSQECGKGIDDVLLHKKQNDIFIWSSDEFEEFFKQRVGSVIPNDMVYVEETEEFYQWKCQISHTLKEAWRRYRLHDKESIEEFLVNVPVKKVKSKRFDPNESVFHFYKNHPVVNTYIGLENDLEAIEGNVDVLLNHMNFLFPEEKERNFFIDTIAWMVQNPGKKLSYSIIVQAGKGVGKKWIQMVMRSFFGKKLAVTLCGEVVDKFNHWAKTCLLLILDEFDSSAFSKADIKIVDRLITEDEIFVKSKYINGENMESYMKVLAFTNEKYAIKIDNETRRWYVICSGAKRSDKDDEYFEQLYSVFSDTDVMNAMYYYFNNKDVSHYKPNSLPPKTKGFQEIIDGDKNNLDMFIEANIEANESKSIFCSDIVFAEDVSLYITNHCPQFRNIYGNLKFISNTLLKVGGVRTKFLLIMGKRKYFYIIRNHKKYVDVKGNIDYTSVRKELEESYKNCKGSLCWIAKALEIRKDISMDSDEM